MCAEMLSFDTSDEVDPMSDPTRIAIPLLHGKVSNHFGRSDTILVYELDPDTKKVQGQSEVSLRSSTCESIPRHLQSLGVRVVLAGRAGAGARVSLAEKNVELISGWTADDPGELLASYLAGVRPAEEGHCDDHDHAHHHCLPHQGGKHH
jgi:predicted Fe-Mo cluster-binding NifX family protein